MHSVNLQFPIAHPVTLFAIVLLVILLVPLAVRPLRIPSLVALILAGTALGPNGFHILNRDASIVLFGTVGLLYIMFLAGLEIDLNDFKKNRTKSIVFGAYTFFIPMTIGTMVSYYFLKFPLTSSILLASMFASHTLLAYPILGRLGITKSSCVNITVGGTMITDTAALLVLAVVAGGVKGELNGEFWIRLSVSFAIFAAIVIVGFPFVGRWFFKRIDDGVSQYMFVLSMVFLAAFLAELSGVEAIIGAFLGGLGLNRLIPHTSPLMNRIEFVGNAIFIPFFLLSVGMLVDFRVFFAGKEALIVAATMTVVATLCKWLAAFASQKTFGFTNVERQVMFGLSNAQAAATLAAVLVGYDLGLLNENVLNGTIVMILFTCLISTFVVENSGRLLALAEAEKLVDTSDVDDRILVPISNPETIESLIDMAVMMKAPQATQPILALSVVPDDEQAEARIVSSRRMLEKAIKYASSSGNQVEIVARVDLNISNGIMRAATELQATEILIGWNPQRSKQDLFFGSVYDKLLKESRQTLLVSHTLQPLNTFRRLILALPPLAEKEPGFLHWLKTVKHLTKQTGATLVVFACAQSKESFDTAAGNTSPKIDYEFRIFEDWDDFLILSRELQKDDLFIVVSARPGTVSFSKIHSSIPKFLTKYYSKDSFLLIFPEIVSLKA